MWSRVALELSSLSRYRYAPYGMGIYHIWYTSIDRFFIAAYTGTVPVYVLLCELLLVPRCAMQYVCAVPAVLVPYTDFYISNMRYIYL